MTFHYPLTDLILYLLSESSAAVSNAFESGEKIDIAVIAAFNKLSEVMEKAEQFNLKGKPPET